MEAVEPLGIPFMLAVGASNRINRTRLIESVIQSILVGAAVALMGYFVAFPVLQEQVAQIRREGLETQRMIRENKVEADNRVLRRDAMMAAQEAKIVQLQIEQARQRR